MYLQRVTTLKNTLNVSTVYACKTVRSGISALTQTLILIRFWCLKIHM